MKYGQTLTAAWALAGIALFVGLSGAQAAGCRPGETGAPCAESADGPGPNIGIGNPVHAVTGNKYQREIDMPQLPGSGGLAIVRHFNSRDPRVGPLGRGWTLDLDARLYSDGRRAQVVAADGTRQTYDCPLTVGPCEARPSSSGTLVRIAGGSIWAARPDATIHFDSNGRSVAIADGSRRLSIERGLIPARLHGEILAVRGVDGRALTFHYDLRASAPRLAAIDTPHGRFTFVFSTTGIGTGGGRLERVVRPDGMTRQYHYEAALQAGDAQRLTGISVIAADRAAVWRLRSWRYDRYGRVILATRGDPDDAATAAHIDYARTPLVDGDVGLTEVRERGGLTRLHTAQVGDRFAITHVEGQGCAGCAPTGMQVTYDARGRLSRANDVALTRDAGGRIREIEIDHPGWPGLRQTFDATGRLTSWYSTATGRETRRYDGSGQLASRHYANGDRLQITRDAAGQPIELLATTPRAPHALRTRIAWQEGRPAQIDHPNEQESRRYDEHGRLIAREVQRSARARGANRRPATRPSAFTFRDGYAWDSVGRLLRHDLPEGGALHYTWIDDSDTLAAIAWTDARGARLPVWPAAKTADARAPLPWRVDLDAAGRVMHETHPERPAWRRAYVYDAASRMVGARQQPLSGTPDADPGARQDSAGATPQANASEQYWYAWQRTGAAAGVQDPQGRELAAIERDPSGLPLRIGARTFHYGADRRLHAIHANGTPLVRYTYNAYGEQITARTDAGLAHRLYSGNRWVADAQASSGGTLQVLRRAIYAGNLPVGWIVYDGDETTPSAGRLLRVDADSVGVPWRLTDQAGATVWVGDHSPTGELRAAHGSLVMPLRLPGQRADAASGLHDNYLRTYDPAAGHYLEPDPLGPRPDNDVYGYAAQQPRRFVDPTGLLLFAFDGTRNDPVTQTNVMLFAQHYTDGEVFYHRGPGRRDRLDWDGIAASSAADILDRQWNHLLDALAAQQQAGQAGALAIDLVGYSRGAALAREFANRIAARVRDGRFFLDDAARGIISACVDLRFIGLFDSVTQFGLLGADDRDFNMAVKSAWRWVAHAVALHERRMIFPVTSLIGAGGNTIEAPFLGAHSDVGGGTRVETGGDISNVALQWMAWQARVGGLDLAPLARHLREVGKPLLHDNRLPRPVFQELDNGDRNVQDIHGLTLYAQQQDPNMGGVQRQAVEPYIDRDAPGTERSGPVAGVVDMRGYRRWLRDALGLQIGQ